MNTYVFITQLNQNLKDPFSVTVLPTEVTTPLNFMLTKSLFFDHLCIFLHNTIVFSFVCF